MTELNGSVELSDVELVELSDVELDRVAAGALVEVEDILNNNHTRILNNSLNNNNVAVGLTVAVASVTNNVARQA